MLAGGAGALKFPLPRLEKFDRIRSRKYSRISSATTDLFSGVKTLRGGRRIGAGSGAGLDEEFR